jgi:hypothetical protein
MGPYGDIRGERSTDAGAAADRAHCAWCIEHPSRPCPACNARRRRAVRLVEGSGLSAEEAAREMRLPVTRVERLLEMEADRRSLAQFRQTHVANAPLRERLLARRGSDPGFTVAAVERRLRTSPIQVERWLGLKPTASKTDNRGRTYPGRILTTVRVETAGRLARAMGYAPGGPNATLGVSPR